MVQILLLVFLWLVFYAVLVPNSCFWEKFANLSYFLVDFFFLRKTKKEERGTPVFQQKGGRLVNSDLPLTMPTSMQSYVKAVLSSPSPLINWAVLEKAHHTCLCVKFQLRRRTLHIRSHHEACGMHVSGYTLRIEPARLWSAEATVRFRSNSAELQEHGREPGMLLQNL